ncbi:MAG: regulatory iron-sulfur-containing complex subunit RicT [Planctomycetota bacterium]
MSVRYGAMAYVATFWAKFAGLRMGDRIVVRTERGVEVGAVLSMPITDEAEKVDDSKGEILRKVTAKDMERVREIEEEIVPKERKFCEQKIKEHNLPMKLADVEHLFGGTKIIFYFLAEGRVDFRTLVKDLAREYQMRIEMRQIGVRDEARLLADVEHCGRELCCKSFMQKLEPVTMKMAKNQKATLDPAKISGRCGRLMCCLRFEDEMYDDLKRELPKKGTRVKIAQGIGEVTGYEVLPQFVTIELDGEREVVVHVSEIEKEISAPDPRQEDDKERLSSRRDKRREADSDDSENGDTDNDESDLNDNEDRG